jgi:hypothetical protein
MEVEVEEEEEAAQEAAVAVKHLVHVLSIILLEVVVRVIVVLGLM